MAFETTFEIEAMEAGNKPAAHKHAKVATWQSTSIVLIAEVIGVGVLGLPYVFKELGWVVAFLGLSLLGLSNAYSSMLLHRLFLQYPYVTKYSDFGNLIGPYTGMVAACSANLMAFGMATLDILVAAQSLKKVVDAAGSHLKLVYSSLIVVGIMLPVVQIKSLHGLVSLTAAGVATIALPLIIVLVKLCQSNDGISDTATVWPIEVSVTSNIAPLFTIVFAYFGSVVQVQLQSEMKQPQDYKKVIYVTSSIFFVVYSMACTIVYLFQGSSTAHKITEQIADDVTLSAVVNSMLFIHACVAAAINACVVNKMLAEAATCFLRRGSSNDETGRSSTSSNTMPVDADPAVDADVSSKVHVVEVQQLATALEAPTPQIRPPNAVWFCVSATSLFTIWIIANSLISFSGLVDVLNASAGMTMLYLLPIIFALVLLDKVTKAERNLLWVLLVITMVFFVVAVYATITELASKMSNSSERPWSF